MGLLVRRRRRKGHKHQAPAGSADRGLAYELFQALVGAALPNHDDYNASRLIGLTSHVLHTTTGDSNAIRISRSSCNFSSWFDEASLYGGPGMMQLDHEILASTRGGWRIYQRGPKMGKVSEMREMTANGGELRSSGTLVRGVYKKCAAPFSPHFSSPVVARRRKGRPGKACDRGLRSRTCTVRRGGRPSETQPGRMIAAT